MHNPTPAPIKNPATGAPTCRGIALRLVSLTPYERETDQHLERDMLIRVCADRAARDGAVLCLRPTADRPACVGLSATAFAVSSLQDDFAARALVVDPYDAEGHDLRERPPVLHERGNVVLVGDDLARIWDAAPGPSAETLALMSMSDEEFAARQSAAVAVWEGSERT